MRIKAEIKLDSLRFHPKLAKGLKNRISFTVTYLIPQDGWMWTKTVDMSMSLPVTKETIRAKAQKASKKVLKEYDSMARGILNINNILTDERKARGKIEIMLSSG